MRSKMLMASLCYERWWGLLVKLGDRAIDPKSFGINIRKRK